MEPSVADSSLAAGLAPVTLLTSIKAEHARTLHARSRVVSELSTAFDRTFTVYTSADDHTIYAELTGEAE